MNRERYFYAGADQELYQTNGYGGTDPDVDITERYTSDIDLTVNLGTAIDFEFDGSGATDDLLLYLYKRRNGTWDGGEIAVWSVTVASDGSADIYHFTIDESYGAGHFRFGLASTGQTDTFEMDVQMRVWTKEVPE